MRRSRWNASISSKTLRKPSGGSTSSTRCGKSRSFIYPVISDLRRLICPSLSLPVLPFHGGCICDLHFKPIGRATGTTVNENFTPEVRNVYFHLLAGVAILLYPLSKRR